MNKSEYVMIMYLLVLIPLMAVVLPQLLKIDIKISKKLIMLICVLLCIIFAYCFRSNDDQMISLIIMTIASGLLLDNFTSSKA